MVCGIICDNIPHFEKEGYLKRFFVCRKGMVISMQIEINNLCKVVDGKYLVKDISLKFESGKIYGIVGQNGSGKTVLFKLLLGLMNKTSGEITVDGKVQKGFMKDVGFIIERPNLIPYYSAYNNLKFISSYKGKVDKQKIIKSLELVGLSPKEKKKVKNYSLGMKQKVAIAMAIMDDPGILILDEPLNAVDDSSVKKIRQIILEYKEKDRIVLIASHYKDDIDYLCDVVYQMKDGEVN